jgi:SAM-dependent methyltransferase
MRPLRFNPKGRPAPKTSWEGVSDWYGGYLKRGDTFQEKIVFPGALRLLAPKDGGRYLDIACGEGAFIRLAAASKNIHAVGIDASASLIQQAKRQAAKRADFLVGDAARTSELVSPASFDGAVSILAIQNIEPFEPVVAGAAKALKPESPFVIVMNHPAFRIPRQSGWGWDENRKLQYRRVDRYLSSFEVPIQAHPGSAPGLKTFSYHRPLSTYAAALSKHGFSIDAIEEWASHRVSDSGPKARAENVARQEIPMFLAIRAKKTA